MTAWTVLTDGQILADRPITQSQGRALRDNVSALAEGASGAPTILRDAISIGSSGVDGVFNNGAAPSLSGIYEFSTFDLTAARTFQPISILRINGHFNLSNVITAGKATGTDAQNALADALGVSRGLVGLTFVNGPGGGSSVGDGGICNGSTAVGGVPLNLASRWWAMRRGLVGGPGFCMTGTGLGASFGGGCLIILVHGDADLTGGTLDASAAANTAGTGNHAEAGGGGGSVIFICDGTVTNGTFKAKGGVGTTNGSSGYSCGGGAGGYVGVVAAAYAGAQTFDVTAGLGSTAGGGGAITAATAGFSEQITLTEKQINGLIFR